MRTALIALVIVVGVADAGPGKVVRIERRLKASAASPRLCQMTATGSGRCVARELKVGEAVVVVDQQHVIAELVIKSVKESTATCRNVWAVETVVTRGALAAGSLGLVAGDTDLRGARMLEATSISPPNAGDRVIAAIDRDGDSREDIVVTGSACDPTMPGSEWACIDVWSDVGEGMQRRERVRIKDCL